VRTKQRLPSELEPGIDERGLVTSDRAAMARDMVAAWDGFLGAIATADLDSPSRKSGWSGREIVAKLGAWDFGKGISDLETDARRGRAGFYDADVVDAMVRDRTRSLPTADVLAAATRARYETAEWLQSPAAERWGAELTSSPLGALPMLTVLNARAYQLAVALLDLETCGALVASDLMTIGLRALVDTTGGLAARQGVDGSFAAITPELIVAAGARNGSWRTTHLAEEPDFGPGVVAPARTVLDVTSGRANVGQLYASGEIRVRDLSGLVRLAPALSGVPGIPPLGAAGRAMSLVDAVGGVLGRLRG
jgi:hypothetical protein